MATLPDVPAPKSSGLALLADTANEQQGTYHYPVKRKGQPRALLPNRAAIAWLEADEASTEIEYQDVVVTDGLIYTFAYGRRGKSHPRPMFQIVHDGTTAFGWRMPGRGCPCGDFSRTAYCDEHGELEFDWDRKQWIRPGTQTWYEHHPEDRPAVAPEPTAYVDTGRHSPNAQPGGLYDRIIEMFSRPLPQYRGEPGPELGTPQRRASSNSWGPETNPENLVPAFDRIPGTLIQALYGERVTRALDPQEVRIEGVRGEGTVDFRVQPE